MSIGRDIGIVDLLSDLSPAPVIVAFGLVTWLGSLPVSLGIVALVYWFHTRRDGAVTVGAVLGAGGLVVGLKGALARSRPPTSLHHIPADGFGFPSGHAVVATVLWGMLALTLDVGSRRTRFGLAGSLIVLVGLSRVVLGVHYAVDVIAGVAIGIVYLVGLHRWGRRAPTRVFGLAIGFGLLAVGLSDDPDGVALLGAALGALAAWGLGHVPTQPWKWTDVRPAFAGAGVIGLAGLGYLAMPTRPLALLVGVVVGGGVIGLPWFVAAHRGG